MLAGGAPKFREGLLEELLAAMGGTGDASSGCSQLVALRNHVEQVRHGEGALSSERGTGSAASGRQRCGEAWGRRRWRRRRAKDQGTRAAGPPVRPLRWTWCRGAASAAEWTAPRAAAASPLTGQALASAWPVSGCESASV